MTTIRAADLLAARAVKSRAPTILTFQVTDRCNYSCSHCYQEHIDNNELSTEEVMDILAQLADEGILFLTIMGGEVFMRPDADAILQRAHDLGFALKVLTTGHHVHDKRADFLASIRPLQVDLSLYGAKPAAHEHITKQPGSWQRTYAAAKRLVERDVPVLLKAPIMESNVGELRDLAKLATDLGAQYSFDAKITAMQDGDTSTVKLRMTGETLKRFYSQDMQDFLLEVYKDFDPKRADRPLDHTPCRAGQQSCAISPEGEVWPCGSLPLPMGDLRKSTFKEIWYGSEALEDLRNLTWASISECNRCELRPYCQRCHGMALIEHGHMKGPSLEACRHTVAIRDSMREAGVIPETETQLPPTWDRIDHDGQHATKKAPLNSRGKRSRALRVVA